MTSLYCPGIPPRLAGSLPLMAAASPGRRSQTIELLAAAIGVLASGSGIRLRGPRLRIVSRSDRVGVSEGGGRARRPFGRIGAVGPRGAGRPEGARRRRTPGHLRVHELARSGSAAHGSPAVGYIRGRDAIPSRTPQQVGGDAFVTGSTASGHPSRNLRQLETAVSDDGVDVAFPWQRAKGVSPISSQAGSAERIRCRRRAETD